MKRIKKGKNHYPPHHRQKSKHAIASVFILAIFIALVAMGNANSDVNQNTIAGNTQSEIPLEESQSSQTNMVDNPQQPNIIVILTDDDPALDGRLLNHMPTAKSLLINQGFSLTNFHSSTPLCCPGRANLLTGQHSHNHKQYKNEGMRLNASVTLATSLQDTGYHTFIVGKYLNSYGGKCSGPFKNYCKNKIPGWNLGAVIKNREFYNYELYFWNETSVNATPQFYGVGAENYSTDVLSKIARQYILDSPPEKPIFAWIATYAPHTPTIVAPRHQNANCNPQKWKPASWHESNVSDKPLYVRQQANTSPGNGKDLKKICKSLLAVDDLINNTIKALEQTGRLNNTIIIYTGDNGMMMGEHGLEQKGIPYQTQVPFYLYWQGLGSSPQIIKERVQNIDLYPTILEITGAQTTLNVNGISFLSLLYNPSQTLQRDAVLEEFVEPFSGIPPWYAITTTSSSPLSSQSCNLANQSKCIWHYIEYPTTGERELYDISNGPCWLWSANMTGDPCELENQINNPAYASIITQLHTRLQELKAE